MWRPQHQALHRALTLTRDNILCYLTIWILLLFLFCLLFLLLEFIATHTPKTVIIITPPTMAHIASTLSWHSSLESPQLFIPSQTREWGIHFLLSHWYSPSVHKPETCSYIFIISVLQKANSWQIIYFSIGEEGRMDHCIHCIILPIT